MLDVEISFGPSSWRTQALVDTGAPTTVFDWGTADALLVRLGNAGARTGRVALMGKLLQVQFENVDLSLADDAEFGWNAEVAFITDRTFMMPFQGLLGTLGFLDKYAVTFNKYYENFTLQTPDEAVGAPNY